MKKLLLLTVTVLFATTSFAQSQEEMAAMQQAWMEFMQPGEVHQLLASYNGKWKAKMTSYMPDGQSMEMEAAVELSMTMDGRYQKGVYEGEMMGMPFRGVGMTGYNNARKMFENIWIDNTGTGITYSEGKWDARTRTVELKGMMTDAVTKSQHPFRQVVTLTDENTQSMTMYATKDGKESKMMDISYTRAD
ncbi:MAG: DUF1579 domain-containing protein [Chitinophagales bacterium]|nr:DUF1579 domain-containing protein [Chitinophagales bacterium]